MKKTFKYSLYLLYLLLFAEIALRIGSHVLRGTPLWDLRRFRSDSHTIWSFNPGYKGDLYTYQLGRINQAGFLGDELEIPKGADLTRVVALGGSVVFGYGVTQIEDNFCSQLERLLESFGQGRFEVVNAGVPGYSSWNGKQFVEHHLTSLQPDLLVVAFGWNDSLLDLLSDGDPRKGYRSLHNPVVDFPFNHSAVAYLARRVVLIVGIRAGLWGRERSESEREGIPPRVSVEDFQKNLAAIKNWCDLHQVKLLFCTEPEAKLEQGAIRRTRLHTQYLETMRQAAIELSIPLADLALAFAQRDSRDLFANPEADYVHPDARGQKEMARMVFEKMREVGYIGR